jgi:hypothetical protein
VPLEQAKEAQPEPRERAMTVSKFTGEQGVGDIDWNEKRATTGHGIKTMLA